jgi:hypothetical protein
LLKVLEHSEMPIGGNERMAECALVMGSVAEVGRLLARASPKNMTRHRALSHGR